MGRTTKQQWHNKTPSNPESIIAFHQAIDWSRPWSNVLDDHAFIIFLWSSPLFYPLSDFIKVVLCLPSWFHHLSCLHSICSCSVIMSEVSDFCSQIPVVSFSEFFTWTQLEFGYKPPDNIWYFWSKWVLFTSLICSFSGHTQAWGLITAARIAFKRKGAIRFFAIFIGCFIPDNASYGGKVQTKP